MDVQAGSKCSQTTNEDRGINYSEWRDYLNIVDNKSILYEQRTDMLDDFITSFFQWNVLI